MSTPALPLSATVVTEPAASPAAVAASGTCAACGIALHGEYCHACGERRMRPDELTLRAFARDVASEVSDLDSRTYRSVRYLLLRPGFLTTEFLAGRRKDYVGPLKLFLASFAVMLVASKVFARSATAEEMRRIDGLWMGGIVDAVAARLGTTRLDAVERINEAAVAHVSWWSVLVPLVLGMVVALVFRRRERGFVAHLVFATHVATFYFALGVLVHPLEPIIEAYPRAGMAAVGLLTVGVAMVYLWRAIASVYGDTGWRAGVRAAALLLGLNLAQTVAGVLAAGTGIIALLYL